MHVPQTVEEETPNTFEAMGFKNVSYCVNANQNFYIYLTKDRTLDTKVILLKHGGGWVSGDKPT